MNRNAAAEFARIMADLGYPLQSVITTTSIQFGSLMVRFHPGCNVQGCGCGNRPFLTLDVQHGPMTICHPTDVDKLVDLLAEARERQWGKREVTA